MNGTIEQLRAAVYGQAIGDALGVPYEFHDRNTFTCTCMIGHGTHNQQAGTWSDDTSMMLATLDSLIGNDWQLTSSPRFKPGDSSYCFAVGEVLVSKRPPRIRVQRFRWSYVPVRPGCRPRPTGFPT